MKLILIPVLISLSGNTIALENDCNCGQTSFDSYSGVWESSYGHLFFTSRTSKAEIESSQEGKGIRAAFWSYPDSHGMADNGRIIGTVNGRKLEGYWIQDSGETPCETERDGSLFWGSVKFQANESFTEIGGAWGLCDQEPEGDDIDWVLWRDEIRNWNPEKD
jgi:hypothetical protein